MESIIFFSLNKEGFKEFLKEAVREVLNESAEISGTEQDDCIGAKEAAKLVHLKLSTIYEKTSNKTIPHIKQGGKLLFLRSELQQWLKDGKVKTKKELEGEAATYSMKREGQK